MQKLGNYIELVKPRLTAMALFSGAVGYVAALPSYRSIQWVELMHLVLALGFVGAASNIMKSEIDRLYKNIM